MRLMRHIISRPSIGTGITPYRQGHDIRGSATGAETDYQMEIFAYYNDYLAIRDADERVPINPVAGGIAALVFTWIDAPALIYDGAQLNLFFEGLQVATEHLGRYISNDDGASWAIHASGNPVPSFANAAEAWSSAGSETCATPIIVDGQRYMCYSSKQAATQIWRIGFATTNDWVAYTNLAIPNNPVLNIGAGGQWDDTRVYHPCIIREGDTFYMFYTGHSEVAYTHPGIGLATTDIANFPTGWTKHANNPFIDMGSRPKVKKFGDFYYMLYVKARILQLAYSDDLINWEEIGPVTTDLAADCFEADFIKVNDNYIMAGVADAWGAGVNEIGILDPAVVPDEVNLNGRCRTDFGDVRFAASDLSELYYYMEKTIEGFFTKFTTKITTIPLGPLETKVYVYYGNPLATENSDPDNTFVFFDDFQTDLSKWVQNIPGTGTITLVTTPAPPEGTQSVELDDTDGANPVQITHYAPPFVLASRDYRVSFYTQANKSAVAQNAWMIWYDATQVRSVYLGFRDTNIDYNDGVWNTLMSYLADVWYLIEYVFRLGDAPPHFDIWVNNSQAQFLIAGNNLNMRNIGVNTGLFNATAAASIIKAYYDFFKVRKYISPEPTHQTWDPEEATTWPF